MIINKINKNKIFAAIIGVLSVAIHIVGSSCQIAGVKNIYYGNEYLAIHPGAGAIASYILVAFFIASIVGALILSKKVENE